MPSQAITVHTPKWICVETLVHILYSSKNTSHETVAICSNIFLLLSLKMYIPARYLSHANCLNKGSTKYMLMIVNTSTANHCPLHACMIYSLY